MPIAAFTAEQRVYHLRRAEYAYYVEPLAPDTALVMFEADCVLAEVGVDQLVPAEEA